MPPVIFLDHLDTGPAVLGDLINISAVEQSKADIGMPQTVTGADMSISVEFQIELVKDGVHQFAWRLPEYRVCRFKLLAITDALEGPDRTRHRFAETDTSLPAHLNLQYAFSRRFIIDDLDVAQLNTCRLIGAKPGVSHKQNIVMKSFADFAPAGLGRILGSLSRGLVKQFVFFGRKPGAMLQLALCLIWG